MGTVKQNLVTTKGQKLEGKTLEIGNEDSPISLNFDKSETWRPNTDSDCKWANRW